MKELYIIGASGFGREVAWLVERINELNSTWSIQGFIDDDREKWGHIVSGYPVLGGCDFFNTINHNVWVVCAVGSAKIRKKIIDKISSYQNIRFPVLIDPDAKISNRVSIDEGTIICAGNIITVDISIGKHNIINLDCTIGHDAILKNYVTLYPSVNVSGNTVINSGCELGTGTHIIQGKTIGNNTIIGAGAVVIRDIPAESVAVGNPAHVIKSN